MRHYQDVSRLRSPIPPQSLANMAASNSPKPAYQKAEPTMWEKTKGASNTAYEKALKPGFNKVYAVVDKLGAPVNRLSNKVGAEAFWPTTMDKESEKAARILRGFCKDGFYDQVDASDAKRVETRQSQDPHQSDTTGESTCHIYHDADRLAIWWFWWRRSDRRQTC